MLGIAQRGGLGVDDLPRDPDVGVTQDIQAFGVRCHDAVLDPVVDHLHEVAGPVRAAMEVAPLGGAAELFASGRPGRRGDAGRQRGEDRVEAPDDLRLAADHLAEAALEPPHAATGADIDVVDALRSECLRATDVIVVVRVAAVSMSSWASSRGRAPPG